MAMCDVATFRRRCRAQPETCKTIDSSCMLLVDSGGQYDCGTTDITRTFHFGTPSSHQKDCYTRVLQVRAMHAMHVRDMHASV